MTDGQIAELLQPFLSETRLAEHQIGAIRIYLELLLKWNAKLNLTAIRDPEEIVTRHFGESLFAARQFFPSEDSNSSTIDIGSGAGFPGLPMKLWAPSLQLTLIESNQRKATFLREVVRALNLSSAVVRSERAETISEPADLVTFRAVEQFEQILPVAIKLVKPGGRIGMLIGEQQVEVAHSLANLRWSGPVPIPGSRNRVVLLGNKQD
jgi:16S rRNA (guanine527-N7)-methyltransferase